MSDNKNLSDEEIVEQVRSKDREMYSIIIERYQHKLTRYVTHLVYDKDIALDIVQSTFIKAFINLNSFDTKKKFSSWIYRIAHNEAMNSIKKYKKEIKMPEGFDFPSDEDITKDFEKKENIIKVEKCLEKIPVLYSEPLSLFYLDEKTYEEISDILRIPMGTVATRISRAKIALKHICQKN
ncbi:RNA polymerase sigma factor [Candidatus Gracilibacteria bacterium]|nr:RNA polymerase sigma factor [Candidatus Gracilibacteria bacterium]MCF7898964.1 RNA polymerase sigma factor [Candidatus Paceibacterota bacterium]